MKIIRYWLTTFISIVVMMLASVAWAQNAVRVPFQSVPNFIGYVEDEFVLVFNPSARANVVARQGTTGSPRVNLPSVQALIDQLGVQRFHRQFLSAKPQPANSRYPDLTGYYKVKLQPGRNLEAAIRAFEANPHVDHVEKIGIHTLNTIPYEPNDPYYQESPNPSFPYDQWHYWASHGIGANDAWDTETGDSNVLVGILDSGIRYFHTDLGGNSPPWGPDNLFTDGNIFINPGETPGNDVDDDGNGFVDDTIGWDFVSSAGGGGGVSCIDQDCSGVDNDPDDGNGHGTHVGGTVAAITNNNNRVAGIAGGFSDGTGVGNGVKLIPLRIGYHATYRGRVTGIVRMDWAAEAMNYVATLVGAGHNVAAVNCSWGSSNSGGLSAALDNLLAHDVMVVNAAGNSNSNSADYLGSRDDVIDVAATDINGNGASFTNHGSWVDVAAPGVDVLSSYRNPDDPDQNAHYIALLSGTSMAAPHVSAIAALLESHNPDLTGPEKFNLIVNNTTPYTDSRDLGSGIANANMALIAAVSSGCDINADFSASPISGCSSLAVSFTDLSTGIFDAWSWGFGDGSSLSTAQNPNHTYNEAGNYSISLTASSSISSCSDTEIKAGYITVSDVPVADFSASQSSGTAPLTVDFTDSSTGNPTSWLWDFGDQNTSTEQNPSHTYGAAGTYTVSLMATNTCGVSEEVTMTDYITVTEPTITSGMFISDIVVTNESLIRGNKRGVATVTIHDDTGTPVTGATVTGDFTGKTTDIDVSGGPTDVNGQVTLYSSSARAAGGGEWCFEVTGVTHADLNYDSLDNSVTQACEN